MKKVVLLGSTGSIGTSTVKVAEDLPGQIRLIGLAAGGNAELLLEQTRKHKPAFVSINDPTKAKEKLGWVPKYDLPALVKEMVHADVDLFRREKILKESGFEIRNQYE